MATVKLNWQLPTLRASGLPFDPATCKHVEISISADNGQTYTVTDEFPPSVLETVFTDLAPGLWKWRGRCVDLAGRAGPVTVAEVNVPDESEPGYITLQATLV